MNEHTEQTQPGATPPNIRLEDFIEAVARGVARAQAAQEEVSGYALRAAGSVRPPFGTVIGLIAFPPAYPPIETTGGGQTYSVRR